MPSLPAVLLYGRTALGANVPVLVDSDGLLSGGGNPFDQDLNTTDSPTFGGMTLSTGGAIKGDTTDAHTYKFQVYDVNGTAMRTWMTATNGNAPSVAIVAPTTGSLTISGLDLSTAIIPAGAGLKRFLCIDENGVVTSQATACA